MEDNKTKEKFIELRASGLSYSKIAAQLGLGRSTIQRWSKDFACEIDNLKMIELEALQEQFYMSKRKRLEVLGAVIVPLVEELKSREEDYEDYNFEHLTELIFKYMKMARKETTQIIFQRKRAAEEIADRNAANPEIEAWTA
jgi:transcriptional regulator with XRE-family HTH domain